MSDKDKIKKAKDIIAEISNLTHYHDDKVKAMSDNTNSAHGFTEGSEFKTETKEMEGKKHRPRLPRMDKI